MKKEKPSEVATAVAYNAEKEKFLLKKRTENTDIHTGKWDFPGGHIEDEEPEKAVRRELLEETCLSGQLLKSGEPFTLDTEDRRFRVHPFLVLVKVEPVSNEEHVEKKWVKPDELDDFETVDGLKRDLRKLDVDL